MLKSTVRNEAERVMEETIDPLTFAEKSDTQQASSSYEEVGESSEVEISRQSQFQQLTNVKGEMAKYLRMLKTVVAAIVAIIFIFALIHNIFAPPERDFSQDFLDKLFKVLQSNTNFPIIAPLTGELEEQHFSTQQMLVSHLPWPNRSIYLPPRQL